MSCLVDLLVMLMGLPDWWKDRERRLMANHEHARTTTGTSSTLCYNYQVTG